jgi:hypothetical protein
LDEAEEVDLMAGSQVLDEVEVAEGSPFVGRIRQLRGEKKDFHCP